MDTLHDEASAKSLMPKWFILEFHERKIAYENEEAKAVSWEECKTNLLKRVKK